MYSKKLRAEVTDSRQLEQALRFGGFHYIYAPVNLLSETTPRKDEIIAVPPVFLGDCEDSVKERLSELRELGFEHAMAHTSGHLPIIDKAGLKAHGGVRLNIANSKAAEFFAEQGAEDLILSCELTAARINKLSCPVPKGIIAYGRLSLMITRRCPINDGKPCKGRNNCGKALTDRQGKKIKAVCGSTVELLNPDVLTLADKTEDFSGADFFVMRFTDEKDIVSAAEAFINGIIPENGFTRGLYYRGVE